MCRSDPSKVKTYISSPKWSSISSPKSGGPKRCVQSHPPLPLLTITLQQLFSHLVSDNCSFATLAKAALARLQIVGSASLRSYCEHGVDSVTFAADLTTQIVEDGPRFIIKSTEKPTPLAFVDTIHDKVGNTDQGIKTITQKISFVEGAFLLPGKANIS